MGTYFGGGIPSTSKSGTVSCWIIYTIIFVILSQSQVASSEKKATVQESQHETDKKRQDLLPYPRIGRSTDSVKQLLFKMQEQALEDGTNRQDAQEQKKPPTKHYEKVPDHPNIPVSEYMLPYLRPGRSETTPQTERDSNDSSTDEDDEDEEEGETTMIPYPRFGRSNNEFLRGLDWSQSVIPYPRLGRAMEQGYGTNLLIPYPRFGRTSEEGYPLTITPYPRFGKRQESMMMLPYPRLGRSSNSAKDQMEILKILNGESEYITPYPRMGKRYPSSSKVLDLSSLGLGNEVDSYIRGKKYSNDIMLPTLRLGRDSSTLLPQIRIGREGKNEAFFSTHHEKYPEEYARFLEYISQGTDTITPYPRMGKRTDETSNDLTYMLPQIRIGRSTGKIAGRFHKRSASFNIPGKESIGNSLENNFKEALSALQHRQQRSAEGYSVLPYPRFGRSDNFPKLKASKDDSDSKAKSHFQKILIHPVEQNYLLPYMRPGRSGNGKQSQDDTYERFTLIPYLRMGR